MTQPDNARALAGVTKELRRFGVLPFTDPVAPSLVTIVAGTPVAGSWWGHPAGQAIYAVGERLDSDPEVLVVKLWRGKVTLVHRRLWPSLARVGESRASWQQNGLTEVARRLLDVVDRENLVRSDSLPEDFPAGLQRFRPALRELERRLLVLTRSVHTRSGAHALEAESWHSWRTKVRLGHFRGSVASAQLLLEEAVHRLMPAVEARDSLPWGRNGLRAVRPGRARIS